jgi:NAD(P)-dependent dehydrogenase (short-subunit alcohol dehydrogenase family)
VIVTVESVAFTLNDVPRLSGRSAIVTGGNSGIGRATALALAGAGARVTLACRDLDSARQAADFILASVPGAEVSVSSLDLASLASVRRFGESWDGPLDLLINNAGVMAPRTWQSTEDGFELQFGVNHLGHFALTGQLLPALLTAERPRVVTVSSLAHRSGDAGVLFGNPEPGYVPMKAYSNSKLANLLFGLELQRRATYQGGRLSSTIAHPGLSHTGLFTDAQGMGGNVVLRALGGVFSRALLQPARAGAVPTLYAATLAEPGSYSGPRYLGEVRGPAVAARVVGVGNDVDLAAQLWDLSEELTEVEFCWP